MTYTFIEYTGRIDFESGQNDFLFGQIVFQFGQNDRKPAFHHIFKSSHDLWWSITENRHMVTRNLVCKLFMG